MSNRIPNHLRPQFEVAIRRGLKIAVAKLEAAFSDSDWEHSIAEAVEKLRQEGKLNLDGVDNVTAIKANIHVVLTETMVDFFDAKAGFVEDVINDALLDLDRAES